MKRFVAVLTITGLILSSALPAYADNPARKLGRGVANVLTFVFEIPKGMGDVREKKGIIAGLTWGICQGAFNAVKRAAVGAYEIGTFPFPGPENYQPILKDPEFFLQKD